MRRRCGGTVGYALFGFFSPPLDVAPPESEMPKIKGPFWVVLVFVYSKGAIVRT